MRTILRINLIISAVLFLSNVCYSDVGTTTGYLLEASTGARAAGRGESFVAASDINSIYYNPAGLGFLSSSEVSLMYTKGGVDTNYEYLAGVLPIKNIGVFGLSVFAFQGGTIDVVDSLDNSTTKNAEVDFLISLAYSKEVLLRGLSLGITNKYLFSTLVDEYRAGTYTFDLGALYRLDEISIGVSVSNIIGGLKYFETLDKLPLLIRGGAEYLLNISEDNEICISGDILSSSKLKVFVGVEYIYQKFLCGRLGYRMGDNGLTLGLGYKLNLSDDMSGSFDYAFLPGNDLSFSHRVSLNIYFGEVLQQYVSPKKKDKVPGVPGRVIQ
ncbi:MAG: PorV/PorQ family protein [Candidatus Firestonebacteria bacterium]